MLQGGKAAARRVVHAARRANSLHARHMPRLTAGEGVSTTPTIYYLCPYSKAPSGGIRVIYRHVDALNAAGFDAAVLHQKTAQRPAWFNNATRVVGAEDITFADHDVLVVPEFYGPSLDQLPVGPRIVIFNQGAYFTFELIPFGDTGAGAPYVGIPGLVGLLTVSHDSVELLRHTFPTLPVHLARPVVDGSVFHPGTLPQRRISYTTHRREREREHLLHILRSRGVLDGWQTTPIDGYTEQETAQIMRETALFLSFSEREGFGLPPAEAMASGCYVIGYTGNAGWEYFDTAYSTPVPDSNILAFAQEVEAAMAAYDADPQAIAKKGRAASEWILGHYTAKGLRDDLTDFFRHLV
jgi:hypothetical protein